MIHNKKIEIKLNSVNKFESIGTFVDPTTGKQEEVYNLDSLLNYFEKKEVVSCDDVAVSELLLPGCHIIFCKEIEFSKNIVLFQIFKCFGYGAIKPSVKYYAQI